MAPNSKARAKASSEFSGEANERGLDITDIHEQWDACVDVRNRLRAGQSLLHPKSGLSCDNSVCRLNRGILEPVLLGMAGADRKLPSLPDLRHEMSCCYRANNRVGKEVQEQVVGDAVHIRKLLSHVKSKTRRQEVDLPVLTKRDQFRLKSGKKDGPRPGRRGKKRGAVAAKAKAGKCAGVSPSKRRRRLLKGASRDEAKESEGDAVEPAPEPKPKAKAKGKAKAKPSPKAKPVASPKAKAKAKAKARASGADSKKGAAKDSKPESKAKPAAEKTTKRGRRAPPDEEGQVIGLDEGLWWFLYVDSRQEVTKIIKDFAASFASGSLGPVYKKDLKAQVEEGERFGLTMYWTRAAVGLLHKSSGVEVGQIAAGGKVVATWGAKMAAVAKAGSLLAGYIDSLVKDGYVEDEADSITQSYDIYEMKEFLKTASMKAVTG
ncbi:unnamed protein product [Symbiodinium sp. KB8]|nr:unnamed protein product [Symbiodinium sp. KB8]